MKKRVQIDSSILSLVIIFTGLLYAFPNLYPNDRTVDNFFDFLGVLAIIKGTLIRMMARGHKKAFSKQGYGLVSTGLYQYVRNPMYLGSFTIGCGFVLMLWPFWSLPLFGLLFYARFIKQITQEEKHLKKLFGKEYQKYCSHAARIFPSPKRMWKVRLRLLLNMEELFSTKEKFGLFWWPLLALILETFQERVVYDVYDVFRSLAIVFWAAIFFVVTTYVLYRIK